MSAQLAFKGQALSFNAKFQEEKTINNCLIVLKSTFHGRMHLNQSLS
jgi:hypothetical protein